MITSQKSCQTTKCLRHFVLMESLRVVKRWHKKIVELRLTTIRIKLNKEVNKIEYTKGQRPLILITSVNRSQKSLMLTKISQTGPKASHWLLIGRCLKIANEWCCLKGLITTFNKQILKNQHLIMILLKDLHVKIGSTKIWLEALKIFISTCWQIIENN